MEQHIVKTITDTQKNANICHAIYEHIFTVGKLHVQYIEHPHLNTSLYLN